VIFLGLGRYQIRGKYGKKEAISKSRLVGIRGIEWGTLFSQQTGEAEIWVEKPPLILHKEAGTNVVRVVLKSAGLKILANISRRKRRTHVG